MFEVKGRRRGCTTKIETAWKPKTTADNEGASLLIKVNWRSVSMKITSYLSSISITRNRRTRTSQREKKKFIFIQISWSDNTFWEIYNAFNKMNRCILYLIGKILSLACRAMLHKLWKLLVYIEHRGERASSYTPFKIYFDWSFVWIHSFIGVILLSPVFPFFYFIKKQLFLFLF